MIDQLLTESRPSPHAALLLAACLVVSGCVGLMGSSPQDTNSDSRWSQWTAPLEHSWTRVSETKQTVDPPQWMWSSALPVSVPRSDLLPATISQPAVAHFFPQVTDAHVHLVSTDRTDFEIRNIDGQVIRNQSDLQRHVARCLESSRKVQIDMAPRGAGETSEFGLQVDAEKLLAVATASSAEHGPQRIVADGNPWLIVTDGGVMARVMVRAERSRGLLHVVLSLSKSFGDDAILPLEVRAAADGAPLACLSASQTLRRLYDPTRDQAEATTDDFSFTLVSEREDYLVPTNYNDLHQKYSHTARGVDASFVPALVNIVGTSYPGPAVLADARALSGILLQRKAMRAGDREMTGWIMFGGDAALQATTFDVALDLGSGLRTVRFQAPGDRPQTSGD